MAKVYQIELELSTGSLRLNEVFASAERAARHIQDCKKPLVLNGTVYPPMEFESHKIIELEVIE